jgi:hypothetical protein
MLKTSPAIEPGDKLAFCAKQQAKPATAILTSARCEEPTRISILIAGR